MPPSFDLEQKLSGLVAGFDEVGRGPWAGPVVAAAVILNPDALPKGINDSKKLSARRREALFDEITATAHVGLGEASVEEIDEINILQASLLAMRRALQNLPVKPDFALVDGNRDPGLKIPTQCIVKGDSLSFSIAAASIIAKVSRDRMMKKLAEIYPQYGWERNAGYGTAEHIKALKLVGITPHHRKSFAPIRESISQDSSITI
jgi:ribonuclease HII